MQEIQAVVPYSDIERMGTAIAKSGLFGMKKPEEAIALMLIAQAEGIHPAAAARDYHIVSGRPALKADAMLARFQAAGGRVEWGKYTDSEVAGTFSHPQGGTLTLGWDKKRAESAGLLSNPTWKKYPRQMLRARCISEAIRTLYPGVSVGIYTPEEIEAIDESPAQKNGESAQPTPAQSKKQSQKAEAAASTAAPATNDHIEEAQVVEEKAAEEHTDMFEECLKELQTAVSIDHLKDAFLTIKKLHWRTDELAVLVAAKDTRKKELQEGF